MGLKKLASKLDDYRSRLEGGKASKVKPKHVEKILTKLSKKSKELEAEIASTQSSDKKARLKSKLKIVRTHQERAEWLRKQLD